MTTLLKTFKIDTILKVDNGQHPRLLKSFMSKKVSLETLVIMDSIIGFSKDWERLISEKVVYPDIHILINKYKGFIGGGPPPAGGPGGRRKSQMSLPSFSSHASPFIHAEYSRGS